MTEHKGSLQWEGDTDSSLAPGQFLREIDNKIDERGHTTERQKVQCLKNNIAFGSDADEWFKKLTAAERDTYEHLTEAFEKQWPLTTAPKTSKAERIQALKEWVLKPSKLAKKVEGPGGNQVWSHVKWATGLASRVHDAEDSTGFLISEVYNRLPRPVQELIRKEPRATYAELATAVLALDTGDLKEAATDFARDEETARLAREPASPTKAIREAFAATRIQAPPAAPYNTAPQPTVPNNVFSNSGGQGNLFGATRGAPIFPFRGAGPGALGMGRGVGRGQAPPSQSLRDRPIPIRHADMVRYTLPHHPDTPEGHAAYRAQVTTWHANNPGGRPDEQHPYPLTPGTADAGSRECWGCGQQGHSQGAPVCTTSLPELEREWRRIAGFITRAFNRERFATSQSVNYVAYSQYTPYTANYNHQQPYTNNGGYEGEIDDGQGNGQGLST